MQFVFILVLSVYALFAFGAAAAPLNSVHATSRPLILVDESAYGEVTSETDYLFRLGMLEGHLMVGHELLQHHQPALALPHFGHPVRELYDEIADYLKAKNFPAFDGQLADLEASVAAAPESPETEKKYQAAITTVHKARELAPASLRASLPEMIKVCSNTIDAASGEFGEALEHGQVRIIVEYHDSRGYLEYVHQQINELVASHKDAASQELLDKFKSILAKAEWIVDPLLPSSAPRASVGQYRAIAHEANDLAKTPTPLH